MTSSNDLRKTLLPKARRLVIKVGSQLLADPTPDEQGRCFVQRLSEQIAELMTQGYEITLVSSGAIATGHQSLGQTTKRPTQLEGLQAMAAIGQTGLMNRWHSAFEQHDYQVAQMLLTRHVFADRKQYLNMSNCLTELHRLKIVPIINENDTVSIEEISLGDNDVLAAMVTNALCADALILLTAVDGLYDHQKQRVDFVQDIQAATEWIANEQTAVGTGGMATKLEAARRVTEAGELAIIARGNDDQILHRLLQGESLGTLFAPATNRMTARDRWLGQTTEPTGQLIIDQGATEALLCRQTSLLAKGILDVKGTFDQGDLIAIQNQHGQQIARGLTNYDHLALKKIAGHHSRDFETILGHGGYDEVVHRDHLVITWRGDITEATVE